MEIALTQPCCRYTTACQWLCGLQYRAVGTLLALPTRSTDAIATAADRAPSLDALLASHLLCFLFKDLCLGAHRIGFHDDGLVLFLAFEQHL
jgi:hypothetical protein